MDRPRISLCMIVRDEEARIGAALASACGVVDEIIVLDTGSRDATVAVAREFGARVESFTWIDDFAAARNAALAHAAGDWVLVLDADEQIVHATVPRASSAEPGVDAATNDARSALERFAREHDARSQAVAGQVEIENEVDGEDTRFRAVRFLPRVAGLAWRGRIHEQPEIDGRTIERAFTGVRVRHGGYARERMHAKDKLTRNRELLRRAVSDDPDDGYSWYQLARTERTAGEPRAALAAAERAVELCSDTAPWAGPLFETAAYALRELGRSPQALEWLSEVEERFRDRPDMCFLIALLALDVGDVERAERGFRSALALRGSPRAAESSNGASGWAALYNLGVLREGLGHIEEARAFYASALELRPGHAPIVAGLARVRAGI